MIMGVTCGVIAGATSMNVYARGFMHQIMLTQSFYNPHFQRWRLYSTMQLTIPNPNIPFDPRFESLHHWVQYIKRRAHLFGCYTALHKPSGILLEWIGVLPSLILTDTPSDLWRDYGRAFFGDVKLYQIWLKTASGGIKHQKDGIELTPTKPKSGNFKWRVFNG